MGTGGGDGPGEKKAQSTVAKCRAQDFLLGEPPRIPMVKLVNSRPELELKVNKKKFNKPKSLSAFRLRI